jgi:polysaccharide pyruvyl transferase WcaK-like protein
MIKNKIRILFQSTTDHHVAYCNSNLGSAAVIQCTAQALSSFIPGAEFMSLIQLSPDFAERNNIRVVPAKIFSSRSFSFGESIKAGTTFLRALLWALIQKYLHLDIHFLIKDKVLREYFNADIIINLSMDLLNDNYGIIPVLENTRDIILGRIFNKPIVIYAQSIGPFNGRFAAWVARIGLNQVTLITAREKNCINWLQKIGVNKPPTYLTADPAFLLKPAEEARVKELLKNTDVSKNKPLIAIAVYEGLLLRTQMWKDYKRFIWSTYQLLRYLLPERLFLAITKQVTNSKYYRNLRSSTRDNAISSIAKLADFLSTELDAIVLLLPHVILPEGAEEQRDARKTVTDVYNLVVNKAKVMPFSKYYIAEDIKGIVGKCDMVISAKMHVTIAATSQCIPTLVIGAHPKFKGIMHTLNMEEWVCENFTAEMMITKAHKLWNQRQQVRITLNNKIKDIEDLALLNAKLASELVT